MESKSDHSGFKLPKGYFKEFPGRLAKRMEDQPRSPKEREGGFRIPADYFDTFSDRLEKRLPLKERPVRSLQWVNRFWFPAAAAAVVILLLWQPSSPTATAEFSAIKGDVLEAYLQTEEFDLTSGELAESISLTDIAMDDVLDNAPKAKQIEEYLEYNIESNEELFWESNE